MTFHEMMQRKGVSLTAAMVLYLLTEVDNWREWPKLFPWTTFDYEAQARRCMAQAMTFVA